MTVSIRRARQRAKTLAAEGGMTHQQALDAIARDEGHGTWSSMLLAAGLPAAPAPAAAPPPVDPLDRDLLSRGPDVIEAAVALMVNAMDVCAMGSADAIVAEVLVRDRIRWVLQNDSPLDLAGETFSAAVARFVSDRLDGDKAAREEALKSGGFHTGSWQEAAQRQLFEAAGFLDIPRNRYALIGMADPALIARQLGASVRMLSEMEEDPGRLVFNSAVARMPRDFVSAVLMVRMRGVVLSEWQASVLEDCLVQGRDCPASDAALVRAHANLSQIYGIDGTARAAFVREVFDVVPGDAGMPFADVVDLPIGGSATARWLRDTVVKAREGRSAFSFNPLAQPLAQRDREALFGVATDLVCMVPGDHDEGVVTRSEQLIVDTALLCARSGAALSEILGEAPPQEIGLRTVHDVIARNGASMEQVSLFASLRRAVDPAAFDEAAGDPRVAELALKALAPF